MSSTRRRTKLSPSFSRLEFDVMEDNRAKGFFCSFAPSRVLRRHSLLFLSIPSCVCSFIDMIIICGGGEKEDEDEEEKEEGASLI